MRARCTEHSQSRKNISFHARELRRMASSRMKTRTFTKACCCPRGYFKSFSGRTRESCIPMTGTGTKLLVPKKGEQGLKTLDSSVFATFLVKFRNTDLVCKMPYSISKSFLYFWQNGCSRLLNNRFLRDPLWPMP